MFVRDRTAGQRFEAVGRFLRDSRASQMYEFAITLPILLMLAVGIADFGQAFELQNQLTMAAREGARFAASESTLDLYQGEPLLPFRRSVLS